MTEQIYDKQKLHKRVLQALREAGGHLTTGQVAMALGVQIWAADQALEEAYRNKEALFTAGAGWKLRPVAEKCEQADDEQPALIG